MRKGDTQTNAATLASSQKSVDFQKEKFEIRPDPKSTEGRRSSLLNGPGPASGSFG